MLDVILFLGPGTDHALAAAPLRAVRGDLLPLDVPGVGDRDHHVLLLDRVLEADVPLFGGDLGAAGVAVLFLQARDLVLDDAEDLLGARQDAPEPLDELNDLEVFLLDLRPLESGEPGEPHLEDRIRLDLGELELAHQSAARRLDVLRRADQGDHRIEVIERDLEAFEDVGALLGFGEVELGAPPHHDLALRHVLVDERAQAHHLGTIVHQRQHDRAERALERGVDEQLVQDHLGIGVLLELDHDAHAVAVGLVAQVADPGDFAFLHQLGDLLEQRGLVDLERDLRDDQAHAALLALFDPDAGAHPDQAPAVHVAVADSLRTVDDATGRKIRAADDLEQVGGRAVRMVDHVCDRVADLAQVVGRHLGGHSHRDPRAPIDEQVGDHARQHHRLLARLVVVGPEVDGVLFEVGQHLGRQRGQAGLRVPHRRRRIAVDRAEVALAVHQRVAHHPVLGEPHQRRIHHLFAVRMVVARGIAGDLRALAVAATGGQVEIVHRHQDPPLRRLESVADVGQRARNDHRHRVVDVAGLHLGLDRDVDDLRAVVQGHGRCPLGGVEAARWIRCPGCAPTGRSPR